MHKSSAVDFNSYSAVDDEYSSSGSYGDIDLEEDEENFSFSTGRTASQEFIVDLAPMFNDHNIPQKLTYSESFKLDIGEDEYSFEHFNSPNTPTIPFRVEPIEGVLINVAHLEQFPKPSSTYSANLPSIFAWFDAQTAFQSEYVQAVQTYFRVMYSKIRLNLKFFYSIAPTNERMQNLSSVKRQIPSGRILFHYIGHGFPKITPTNIWTSEKRSTDFRPFDLKEVFVRLRPPTWFIFDCSNAAVVIPTFIETAKKQPNISGVDWSDWFCICATDVGEELPSDPRIPRDFLTACVLTSIKMAIVCHILQHYRVDLVGPNFPFEVAVQNLWGEHAQDQRLSLILVAITDAIAADSLPPELYHKIFRCDRLSAVLFRHFLLAQYLLSPYKVHPKSHPELPDLSKHKLWHQWSAIIDTAICSSPIARPAFASDMFSRLAISFEQILQQDRLQLVRPYHLTILFHMLFTESTNNKPLFLLSEYAANPKSNPKILVLATVFHCLIRKLMEIDIDVAVLHSLGYLILYLLYHHPAFATEIRKEINVDHFPNLIFNTNLPENTRVLVIALVANLVVTNERIQQICTTGAYLTKIREILADAPSRCALWYLILIRRSFHLFSPESDDFVLNGLHVQCACYIFHKASSCRAAAISAITCFLRPFESDVNGQLLFMVLPTFADASYLVRFHLLLLLKKFVVSFDNCSDSINVPVPSFPRTSYSAMLAAFYRAPHFSKDNFFTLIDNVVRSKRFIQHAYSVAVFIITLFIADPHQSVSRLATRILSFVNKQKVLYQEHLKKQKQRRSRNKAPQTNRNHDLIKSSSTMKIENSGGPLGLGNLARNSNFLGFGNLNGLNQKTGYSFVKTGPQTPSTPTTSRTSAQKKMGVYKFGKLDLKSPENQNPPDNNPHVIRSGSITKLTFTPEGGEDIDAGSQGKNSMLIAMDEEDTEQNTLTNLDQNESLHQIALRNLINKQQWKLDLPNHQSNESLASYSTPIPVMNNPDFNSQKQLTKPIFSPANPKNTFRKSRPLNLHNISSGLLENSSSQPDLRRKSVLSISVSLSSTSYYSMSKNVTNVLITPAVHQLPESGVIQMIPFNHLKLDVGGKKQKFIKAAFHRFSLGIATATNNAVYYIQEGKKTSIKCAGVKDLKVVEWRETVLVIILNEYNEVYVWDPRRSHFTSCFKCSMSKHPIMAVHPYEPYMIFTGDDSGTITKWDLLSYSIVGDWTIDKSYGISSLVISPSTLNRVGKPLNNVSFILPSSSPVVASDCCIVGLSNGTIKQCQLNLLANGECRCSLIGQSMIHTNEANQRVEKDDVTNAIQRIIASERGIERYFAVSNDGECVTWESNLNSVTSIQYHADGLIFDTKRIRAAMQKTLKRHHSLREIKLLDDSQNKEVDLSQDNQTSDETTSTEQVKNAVFNDFDVHPICQVLMFSPENDYPYLTDMDGKILYSFRAADKGSFIAIHPIYPVFAVSATTRSGDNEIILYNLDQK